MSTHLARMIAIATCLAAAPALPVLAASAPAAASQSVSLAQDPVVMRLSKDEFRIAFGLNAERCLSSGCSGVIRYRVDWRTEDGSMRSEIKRVSYTASRSAPRAVTVDRQYFDTSEGAHTTQVVRVSVDMITWRDGADTRAIRTASTAPLAR